MDNYRSHYLCFLFVCLLLLLFCFDFSEVRRQLHEWTRLPCPRDNPWKAPLVTQKAFGVTRKRGRQCDSQLLGGCTGSPAGQQYFRLQHMQSPKSHFSLRNCVGHLIFPHEQIAVSFCGVCGPGRRVRFMLSCPTLRRNLAMKEHLSWSRSHVKISVMKHSILSTYQARERQSKEWRLNLYKKTWTSLNQLDTLKYTKYVISFTELPNKWENPLKFTSK